MAATVNYNTNGPAPSYLAGNDTGALQSYLGQLPSMFNTSGLQSSYATMNQGVSDNSRAMAAAAANAYVNRARQSGASQLGAGFAQAGAMLPGYAQIAQNNADLAGKQLQYTSQQAQIGAGLSSDIGKLQAAHQSALSDYYLNQQKLQQSQSQFGQDLGFRQQQLAQQQSQFGQSQAQQLSEFGQTNALQLGNQQLNALQLASRLRTQPYGYSTDMGGNPLTAGDASNMQMANQQNQFGLNLRNSLASFF